MCTLLCKSNSGQSIRQSISNSENSESHVSVIKFEYDDECVEEIDENGGSDVGPKESPDSAYGSDEPEVAGYLVDVGLLLREVKSEGDNDHEWESEVEPVNVFDVEGP